MPGFGQNLVMKFFWETTEKSIFVQIKWFYAQKVRIELLFKVRKK